MSPGLNAPLSPDREETPQQRAIYCRQRAAEARARADQMHHGRDRDILLDVAAGWERLADLEGKTPPLHWN